MFFVIFSEKNKENKPFNICHGIILLLTEYIMKNRMIIVLFKLLYFFLALLRIQVKVVSVLRFI